MTGKIEIEPKTEVNPLKTIDNIKAKILGPEQTYDPNAKSEVNSLLDKSKATRGFGDPVLDTSGVPKTEAAQEYINQSSVMAKGQGVEHVFKQQLIEDPKKFGYNGNLSDEAAIKKWAGSQAHKIALDNGYINKATGEEIRIKGVGIGRAAYELDLNENGKIKVTEYFDEEGEGKEFVEQEINESGKKYNDGTKNDYEYDNKRVNKTSDNINTVVLFTLFLS